MILYFLSIKNRRLALRNFLEAILKNKKMLITVKKILFFSSIPSNQQPVVQTGRNVFHYCKNSICNSSPQTKKLNLNCLYLVVKILVYVWSGSLELTVVMSYEKYITRPTSWPLVRFPLPNIQANTFEDVWHALKTYFREIMYFIET